MWRGTCRADEHLRGVSGEPAASKLWDVEAVRDGVASLPVRREAHGRVVGQCGGVVAADARVDVPQPGGLRCCQRRGEETATKSGATSLRVDVGADDPPPLTANGTLGHGLTPAPGQVMVAAQPRFNPLSQVRYQRWLRTV